MPTNTRAASIALAALLAAAAPAAPARGGTTAQPTDRQARPAQPSETIELAATAFELRGIGMRFRLPVGATASSRRLGPETHAVVVGPDSAYQITVSSRSSSNTALTTEAAAEAVLVNLKAAHGITDGDADQPATTAVATFARVLRPVEAVPFANGVAHRFLLLEPATRGTEERVRGVAVIQIGPGRMLVWDAHAPSDEFERLAGSIDAMLATVEFDDPNARLAGRGIAVAAGSKLLEQLGPDDLREILGSYGERWARLYTIDDRGNETDLGYRRVRASVGTRAEINDPPRARGPADREPGYLVRIDARSLDRDTPGGMTVYDSRGTYWVSEDFESEAWTITVAIKQGSRTSTYASTGAREGFEEIVVTSQSPTGGSENIRISIDREGYLPTPLTLLLPAVLVHAEVPGDFAFYAYRSDAGTVSYRTDSFRQDDDSDAWIIRSVTTPGGPEIERRMTSEGELIREVLPDGKFWEPIELRELAALWRRQGLPLN
ncbi:MAG: hypothetical protein AAGF47_04780 [Planctomycetota bacterium]